MTHLGALACALVDGELDTQARDRALAHLARCAACRADVCALSRVAARLRLAPEPFAADVPPALAARLLQIPAEPARHSARVPAALSSGGAPVSRTRAGRPVGSRPNRPPNYPGARRRRPNRAVGLRSVAAVGLAASVLVGLSGAVSRGGSVPAGFSVGTQNTAAVPAVAFQTAAAVPAVAVRRLPRTSLLVVYRRP